MSVRPMSRMAACVALTGLCASMPASSPAPPEDAPLVRRVLVTAGLDQRTVNIISLSEQELVARDASTGTTVRVPLSSVRALLPVMLPLGGTGGAGARQGESVAYRPRISADETALLVTTDTQSFPGRPPLGTRVTSPDVLPWQSDLLGSVTVPLDNARRILSRHSLPSRPAGSADRVYLRNGDTIDGFVELTPESPGPSITLSVDVDGADRPSRVEWASVESVEFAAPPQPAHGAWAWLSDGTAIAATSVAISTQGAMTLSWPSGSLPGPIPAASLWAFTPAREHIDALASRPIVGTTPGANRRYAQQPRTGDATDAPLGAQDIELSGPITALWDLGPGALRIAGAIEMAPSDRVWGDCTVTIEDATSDSHSALTAPARELWSARINADAPTATFTADLPDQSTTTPRLLRVRITDGANGPIQDRVWLRRVLIER